MVVMKRVSNRRKIVEAEISFKADESLDCGGLEGVKCIDSYVFFRDFIYLF